MYLVVWQAITELLTGVASGVVLGIAALLIMYKTVDGDIPAGPGIASIGFLLLLVIISVRPPHPYLPGIVLVVAITLMVGFPYAAEELTKHEMRIIDTGQLDRAFQTFAARPDNVVARLQIAKGLHMMGYRNHAVAVAQDTLRGISSDLDPVLNRSQRDLYREEDNLLTKWIREAQAKPSQDGPLECVGCKFINPMGTLACQKCGRLYLLDHARKVNLRQRIYGKLLLTWTLIAALIVTASWIGLYLGGILMVFSIIFLVGGVGGALYWLFRPPQLTS